MGQYYNVYMLQDNKERVFDRTVDGEYMMAKIMEHSWWHNIFMQTMVGMLYKSPARIAWVGDYSDDDVSPKKDFDQKKIYDSAWGEESSCEGVKANPVSLDNKFLVNHDKGLYLDCNKYKEASLDADGWAIHPLSLLTAIGNGKGGGDYWGENQDVVGVWYMDLISVEDTVPEGYTEFVTYFKE